MYWEPCTAQQLREFYAEFNATPESARKDVRQLMEWLEDHPTLPSVKDEEWLENFFLRCKMDMNKTKSKLEYYFSSKTMMPEVFENQDPCSEEVTLVGNCALYIPMPKLTPEGYRVFVFRIFDSALASKISALHLLKSVQMLMELSMKQDKHKGVIVLVDMANPSLAFIQVGFKVLRKLLAIETKINPMRFHKILVLNLIKIAEPIVYISKALMPKKIGDRVHIWKRPLSELSSEVPADYLPLEYGGNLKSITELKEEWTEYFQKSREWQTQHEKLKMKESKKKPLKAENDTVTQPTREISCEDDAAETLNECFFEALNANDELHSFVEKILSPLSQIGNYLRYCIN